MKLLLSLFSLFISLIIPISSITAQVDSLQQQQNLQDSVNIEQLKAYEQRIANIELERKADSLKKVELELQLRELKSNNNSQKESLQKQIDLLEANQQKHYADKKAQIESMRKNTQGYAVIGALDDTLFYLYSKIGASTPKERAATIHKKIQTLYEDDYLKLDSIQVVQAENTYDISYGETIIMSVSENDAIWYDQSMLALANDFSLKIKQSIQTALDENSLLKLLLRIALVLLVLSVARLIIWLVSKGYVRLLLFIKSNKENWLKDLSYKDYTFLSAEQELQVILFLVKVFRWFVYALLLYITLPILFSIFPFSRNWAEALLNLIWSPFRGILVSIWQYLPNLFSILVIYFVMKYVIRFVKYIFHEIESEKLEISGFHSDWAMPTYSIIKFLLYAFMFVLIFPYLPGSDSNIFKGVSVFIGVLFSLGSSSAIANMIAGLVITYMRPFKIGDRIKISDTQGDVIEKTLLVTRVRTIKNEIITIPNSSVLTGNTTNYTQEANERGLIIHTTITIGYDVPWRLMHEVLIEAAKRTKWIMPNPQPFVLQTSLDDFYVAYQINAFTKEASKQALIYSDLHANIQDVCNEKGVEILSPHYRAARDGNHSTIPASYLPEGYTPPPFNVNMQKPSKD